MPDWESQMPQAPGGPGALLRAAEQDNWTGGPFSSDANSFDTGLLFGSGPNPTGGAWSDPDTYKNWRYGQGDDITDSEGARRTGRAVGTAAATYGLGFAFGGGAGAGAAEAGGSEAGGAAGYDPSSASQGFYPGDPSGGAPYDSSGFPGDPGNIPGGFPEGGAAGLNPTIFSPPMGSSWSSYIPTFRQAAYGIQAAGGIFGMANAWEMRKARKEQERRRKEYQDRADALMANPNSVRDLPGYQFGIDQGTEALHRRMAAMGYGTSGNVAMATQKYGQDYASSQLDRQLALLRNSYDTGGGSDIRPVDPIIVAMQSLRALGYGMGGMN